jgi:hypothetical protein
MTLKSNANGKRNNIQSVTKINQINCARIEKAERRRKPLLILSTAKKRNRHRERYDYGQGIAKGSDGGKRYVESDRYRSFHNEMGNVTMRLMKPGNFSTAAKL